MFVFEGKVNIPKSTNPVFWIIAKNKYASRLLKRKMAIVSTCMFVTTGSSEHFSLFYCVILSDCIISHRVIWRYITFHNDVLRLVMLRYITKCHIIVLNVLVWIFTEPSTAFGDKHSLGSTKRTERNNFFILFLFCR